MGLDRGGAARFAALLSMPAVLLLCAHALLRAEGPPVSWSLLAVGAGIGAPAAWLGIRALLWLLDRVGVWPVVVWQVVVGSLALWRVAGG
jgi:undecaprenyl-diphosphatase